MSRAKHRILFALTVAFLPAHFAHAQAATDRVGALYRESYLLEAKRDYAGALAKVQEASQSGSNAYFAKIRMGWLSYLSGDNEGSAARYAEAVAAEPKAVEPRLGLTLPLLAAKNWHELERACRDALTLDPGNATALSRLAIAYYWGGNFTDAATTYRRLVEQYPSELDYQTGLGWALLKLGRANDARPVFEAVLAVSPDNVNAKLGLAAK